MGRKKPRRKARGEKGSGTKNKESDADTVRSKGENEEGRGGAKTEADRFLE